MQFLVDTDWVIDCLNCIERVAQRLDELRPRGIGLSMVSLAELYEGVFGAADPQAREQELQAFLADVEIVDLDSEVCRVFAEERRRLRAVRSLIGDFDLLIGATALRHNLTLLTNNRRHFERVQGLTVLSV